MAYKYQGKDCQRMTKSQFGDNEHCNHLGRTLADFPKANATGSSILFCKQNCGQQTVK